MKFRAVIIPSGNATCVEVPADIMRALGPEARPPVAITINGHAWRSRVARMRGRCLIGISAGHREAAKVAEGDIVEIDVHYDGEPREVSLPADLLQALNDAPGARTAFDSLPFGLKRKRVAEIEQAKGWGVRRRRIDKLIASLI